MIAGVGAMCGSVAHPAASNARAINVADSRWGIMSWNYFMCTGDDTP